MFNKIKNTKGKIICICILIILIFLSYNVTSKTFYKKIRGGDDLEQFTEANILKENKLQIFDINRYSAAAGISTHYTPMMYVFWIPLLASFDDNAELYLKFCFIVHALNAILLFFLILQLSHSKLASLLGSALFLFFPGNIQTMRWISASIIYAPTVLFMLLTLLFFIHYLKTKKKLYFFVTLIFYLSGCLTKQVFYPFFVILASYEVLIHNNSFSLLKQNKESIKKLLGRYAPFIGLSTMFALIQIYRYKLGWIYQLKGGALFHPIIFYRLLDFVKEFLWPHNLQNYCLRFALILSLFVLFYCLFFYSKNKLLKFSIIWVIILGLLSMTQHLRSIPASIRYVYIISPGFFMLISFLYAWKKWLRFIPFVLLIIYFLSLYNVL